MQNSAAKGSQGVFAVNVAEGVTDGTGVEGREVLVNGAFVFTATGVSVPTATAQDTRIKERRRLKIRFMKSKRSP